MKLAGKLRLFIRTSGMIAVIVGAGMAGIAAIWSGYWALALEREGYRWYLTILAHRELREDADRTDRVIVQERLSYQSGEEEIYEYECERRYAPCVGTVERFFTLTGPEVVSTADVRGDWYYVWESPILCGLAASVAVALWWIACTFPSGLRRQAILAGLLLALVLAISNVPLERVRIIAEYVRDQRLNNQLRGLSIKAEESDAEPGATDNPDSAGLQAEKSSSN